MKYDAIPTALLSKCLMSLPPTEEDLVKAIKVYPKAKSDMEARMLMMTDAWFEQTGNLIACDVQVGKLFEWNSKHLENRHDTGRNTVGDGK